MEGVASQGKIYFAGITENYHAIFNSEGDDIFLPPKKFDSYRLAGVISSGNNSDETILNAVHSKKLINPIYAKK